MGMAREALAAAPELQWLLEVIASLLFSDTFPEISLNNEKTMPETSYPNQTTRLPPITYTGRFSLEPAPNGSNTLWPEPLFSLVSGLVSMANAPPTSTPSSSSPSSSQSTPLSCSVQASENSPIYSAAPTFPTSSSDIFPEPQTQPFPCSLSNRVSSTLSQLIRSPSQPLRPEHSSLPSRRYPLSRHLPHRLALRS